MNNNRYFHSVSESVMVPAQMTFFLIVSMVIGVGVLGFERYIVLDAGYDSWISIIIAGLWVHVLVWIIYQLLKDGEGDIFFIHENVFGSLIGKVLSVIFSIYLLVLTITVLRTFAELIQLWIFPQMNVWIFCSLMILITYYFVAGGFRTVTGICFFSVILGLPLVLLNFYPLQYAHLENVYPIIDHSLTDLLKAAKTMSLSFVGFELMLVFYPFIKRPTESLKWAQFGILFCIFIYLESAISSFVYFSETQIEQVIWATISRWKVVEFPFIARFEYIGMAMYLYVILPNICLSLWAASRAIKRAINIKQTYVLWGYMVLIVVVCGFLKDRPTIDTLNAWTGTAGFYLTSVYIPFLFIIQKAVLRVRRGR